VVAISGGLWLRQRCLGTPVILLPNVVAVQWGAVAPVDGSSPPKSVLFFFSTLFLLLSSLFLFYFLCFFRFLFLIPLCFGFFISSFSHHLPLFCWFPPFLSISLSLSFFLLPSYVLFGFFLSVSPSSYFFLLFPLLSLLSLGFFFYLCSSLFSFSQYHCLSFLLICFPPFCFFNPPSVRPPLISFLFPPIY